MTDLFLRKQELWANEGPFVQVYEEKAQQEASTKR